MLKRLTITTTIIVLSDSPRKRGTFDLFRGAHIISVCVLPACSLVLITSEVIKQQPVVTGWLAGARLAPARVGCSAVPKQQ